MQDPATQRVLSTAPGWARPDPHRPGYGAAGWRPAAAVRLWETRGQVWGIGRRHGRRLPCRLQHAATMRRQPGSRLCSAHPAPRFRVRTRRRGGVQKCRVLTRAEGRARDALATTTSGSRHGPVPPLMCLAQKPASAGGRPEHPVPADGGRPDGITARPQSGNTATTPRACRRTPPRPKAHTQDVRHTAGPELTSCPLPSPGNNAPSNLRAQGPDRPPARLPPLERGQAAPGPSPSPSDHGPLTRRPSPCPRDGGATPRLV